MLRSSFETVVEKKRRETLGKVVNIGMTQTLCCRAETVNTMKASCRVGRTVGDGVNKDNCASAVFSNISGISLTFGFEDKEARQEPRCLN